MIVTDGNDRIDAQFCQAARNFRKRSPHRFDLGGRRRIRACGDEGIVWDQKAADEFGN